jgi:LmbE family N-acetylglucosaminyl deacetylase
MSATFNRVLAIGAHPDDIEYSCLGYLLKLKRHGSVIAAYVASSGSAGDPTSGVQRVNESRKALGVVSESICIEEKNGVDIFDFEAAASKIRRVILDFKPTLILVHSKYDTHQEHRYLYDLTMTASRRVACSIFTYKSVSVTSEFNGRIFVDISDYLVEKIELLGTHQSQKDREYMQQDFIESYHKNWFGQMNGIKYCEIFSLEQLILD